jgi:hypothetical protein
MQPTSHLSSSHKGSADNDSKSNKRPPLFHQNSNGMEKNFQEAGHYVIDSSGTTSPSSTRSSSSHGTSVSSTSRSSRPNLTSMKSSLKPTSSKGLDHGIRASRTTVRFIDPEPLPRPRPTPVQRQQQQQQLERTVVPNPLLRYRHRSASTVPSPASSGPQAYSTPPPRGVPTLQPSQIQYRKTRVGQRFSAPVQPSRHDSRWSGIPLPANFTPPSLALEQRVTSFQSVASNLSVQSAPAVLQSPVMTSPSGQYNPLEHYLPCMHAACKAHYSPALQGPTYYLPQGAYSLSKHHGNCAHHASKELRETNALCKREWERLRQNAGRKTLGQIANDFDFFLDTFRQDRRAEEVKFQRRQRHIVLDAAGSHAANPQDKNRREDEEWKWSYNPRHCTRSSCSKPPYSPFANHLYLFYHTARSSTLTPLPTLCPACAKNEVEAFERYAAEKWGSRGEWDDVEWNEWFGAAVRERDEEKEFWLRAQERVGKEMGSAIGEEKSVRKEKVEEKVEEKEQTKKAGKKRGVLRRWFSSN